MRKLTFTLALLSVAAFAFAETDREDITSQYLKNPSFEEDDLSSLTKETTRGGYPFTSVTDWTFTSSLSSGYGQAEFMTAEATATDNDYGAPGSPSDGTQMVYLRDAWNSTSASLMQSVTLPAGTYALSVDNKCVTEGSGHSVNLVAGDTRTSLTFQSSMPSQWSTAELVFTLDEETTLDVGVSLSFANVAKGGSVLLDNFRLYQYPEGYEEPEETDVTSPTEGVITQDFVREADMMADILQMIANFSQYMVNDFYYCVETNSINEDCGYFKGESSGASNEEGVRTNADLSMLCAFLVKYAKNKVTLPSGVTWSTLEDLAKRSLIFAYSTHKANKLKITSSGDYWGSTAASDYVWESSLWALSVAYSAYFQWDSLSDTQKNYIYAMLKAECNYELERTIPTGYSGDTKAEENGWEAGILAATLGLFPDDPLADKWFSRLREFAINSYSHYTDASNTTVIDPSYDNKTVADLYIGDNLYTDYTLQNHSLFHTSYQNVVMQELGEAALALKMFQGSNEKWQTNALMHNNQEVMDSVLNWLALTDGELAMPNGNDWSLFLYDQITSYTTQACFQSDPNALMLENMAYKNIKARQQTTSDGSWLLRPDVGARRMGVEGHRVMMTYLMHLAISTADLTPTDWEAFRSSHSEAKVFPCQDVVRAFTKDRFTTFSWSSGLSSYTGYFASNTPDKNKILVPYRANNTGNLLGWYTVSGQSTNATPVVSGEFDLDGDAYTMNGELKTNGSTLDHRFAIYSTPGNAVIYLDYVTGLSSGTITGEYGGLLAISTDELTKLKRTLYYASGDGSDHKQLDGTSLTTFSSDWVNIDNELGVIGQNGKKMAFGDREENNSIYTSKLYPMYSTTSRTFKSGTVVDRRGLVYYSSVDAETTAEMNSRLVTLTDQVPEGWNALIASDPDDTRYLLIANFQGETEEATLTDIQVNGLAPVFKQETTITDSKSTATFSLQQNHSEGSVLSFLVEGSGLTAQLDNDSSAYVAVATSGDLTVHIGQASREISVQEGDTLYITLDQEGNITYEQTSLPEAEYDPTSLIVNPNFDEGTNGWEGSPSVSYSCAEKWNTTFDVYQTITGLTPGLYRLSCQGFYRDGGYASAASLRSSGKEVLNAYLYAKSTVGDTACEVDTALVSIFTEAGSIGTVGVSTSFGYVPNTMEQTHQYFLAGLYPNSLEPQVGEDETLTIGVRKTVAVSDDWAIFDTFTLEYLGQAPDEEVEEGEGEGEEEGEGESGEEEEEEDPTGLSPVSAQASAVKVYTLTGARIPEGDSLQPGVYIVNGRKVLR
ncbi:MAG: hypothetical protein LUC86_09475 [Prevotellaceae bacterium]|nr:hypothetical protein [Prevotellaceae bacterium]